LDIEHLGKFTDVQWHITRSDFQKHLDLSIIYK
jgi:hypothetical protein